MKKVLSVLLVALMVVALVAVVGCDQKVKQENEQLKAKVTALEKDKADLTAKVAATEGERDACKKELEAKTKKAPVKGKAATKPAAKPAPKK